MKKNNPQLIILYILLLYSVATVSCKKSLDESLDVAPRDRLTNASVWTDVATADVFLNDIYGQLPDGNNYYDPLDNWTDNSICGFAWPFSRNVIQQSNYTSATNATEGNLSLNWSSYYGYIRKCNVFIENVTASPLPDDYKGKRIAEARFLRAYFYHLLWMTYGGLPIITQVLNVTTQGDSV
ncbi:MAG TPA: RagB/SusD family nutrient uptake outer membrane protein, partial [Flavitalea sp.]|nr:RagB/SusD family nutrient uptake outer membrane protein [Flavitalea sp.]